MMDELDRDIAAFERMRSTLEARHMGQWVVFYHEELIGTFDTFDHAAAEAVQRFKRGPFLIRQVGAEPMVLPASVMYCPVYAVS
jgi:hypothetical protein